MGNNTSDSGENVKTQKLSTSNDTKILFMGLPGSGTMQLVETIKNSITLKANQEYTSIIQYTIYQTALQLIKACEVLEISIKKDYAKLFKEVIKDHPFVIGVTDFNPDYGEMLSMLWEKIWKQAYEKRTEFRVKTFATLPHAKYWMENVKRISEVGYLPTEEDVKYYQDNFTDDKKGIVELKFELSGIKFRIFIVEGQKTDQTNWIDTFEGVDIVAFLCPIGDFDLAAQNGFEKNIVIESLNYFGRMCNSKWFQDTPVILLFSKYDEFEEKTKDTDMICCFSDYLGGCIFETALSFVSNKFFEVRKAKVKDEIYVFFLERSTTPKDIVVHIDGIVKNIKYIREDDKKKKVVK